MNGWHVTDHQNTHKIGAVFGFQFGKVLPGQTQEHFPSTCYFFIIKYQMSSTAAQWAGEPKMMDGAIITHLIWHLHWHLPPLQPPRPCGSVPHSRDTWTPPHTDGWAQSNLEPQTTIPAWQSSSDGLMHPQTPNLLFAVCKSHPFTNQRLLQPLRELKPHKKYQDLIM